MPVRHIATHVPLDWSPALGSNKSWPLGATCECQRRNRGAAWSGPRCAAAKGQFLPLAESLTLQCYAIGQQLGDDFPAVQRGEFQILAIL